MLCRYFLHNSCKFGSECRYSHVTRLVYCPRKKCKFKQCKFKHENRECKFYKLKKCTFGEHCWFQHIDHESKHEISKGENLTSFSAQTSFTREEIINAESNLKITQENKSKTGKKIRNKLTEKLKRFKAENLSLKTEIQEIKSQMSILQSFVKKSTRNEDSLDETDTKTPFIAKKQNISVKKNEGHLTCNIQEEPLENKNEKFKLITTKKAHTNHLVDSKFEQNLKNSFKICFIKSNQKTSF